MSEDITKEKDNAYWERNQLVSALSKVFPSHLAKHPEDDKEWEDDWRTIVVIELPVSMCDTWPKDYEVVHTRSKDMDRMMIEPGEVMKGKSPSEDDSFFQLSWHIHNTDISMFDHLVYKEFDWDRHTTEDKYRRLRRLKKQLS